MYNVCNTKIQNLEAENKSFSKTIYLIGGLNVKWNTLL